MPLIRACIAGALALSLAAPANAHAQVFGNLDKLFENFTDVSIFANADWFTNRQRVLIPSQGAKRTTPEASFGTEFLWEVRKIPKATKDEKGNKVLAPAPTKPCIDSTKATEVRITSRPDKGRDTTWAFATTSCTKPLEDRWLVEVGVAYTQSNRLVGNNTFGMVGVVRQFPRVGIYVSDLNGKGPTFYRGVTFGLSKLDELRITGTGGETVTGTADAMTGGILIGLGFDESGGQELPFTWFIEASLEASSYPTIKWSEASVVPAGAPKRVDLHRLSITLGLQLKVREKK